MPPVFVAAAAAIGSAIGTSSIITALYYASVIAYGVYSARQARKKAKQAAQAALQDRLVMLSTTDGPRARVYGRVRNVDGLLFKATRGKKSQFYTLVIALAGHEIDAVEQVFFDDVAVALDSQGNVVNEPWGKGNKDAAEQSIGLEAGTYALTTSPIAASISIYEELGDGQQIVYAPISSTFTTVTVGAATGISRKVVYQYASQKSNAKITQYLGAPGQDLSAALKARFPDLITDSDKFAGVACLVADLEYSTDSWPTGVPTISARMRGAKVYDPRTGTTAWSQNPALIALDWAKYAYGGNVPAAAIDEASFAAAANACDVMTSFAGASPIRTYTAGIVCHSDQAPDDNLNEIVEAMAGRWGWSSGQLRVRAGAYRAPVAHITEDWLSGAEDISIVPEPQSDEAVNVLRPTIADAAHDYVATPTLPVPADAYITLDGRELPQDVTYNAVTDAVRAQHVAGVQLREARSGLTSSLPCNLRAFPLQLFDVVTCTLPRYGWSSKLFEVVDWRFSLQGGVVLGLRETAASSFDPAGTFDLVDATPNTALPDPTVVDALGDLTITSGTSTMVDGSIVTRTRVQWPAPDDAGVLQSGHIEIQFTPAGTAMPVGDWPSVVESGSSTEATIVGLLGLVAYRFRARAINSLGVKGAWSHMVTHVITAPPDASIKLLRLSASSLFFRIATGGSHMPASIDLQATQSAALLGAPTFSITSGTATLTGSGNSRNLTFENMGSDVVTISATIIDASATYTDSITLIKLRDGQPGPAGADGADGADGEQGPAGTPGSAGQRGTVEVAVAVAATSWSNSAATAALSAAGYGSPVFFDRVIQYNVGASYTETRYWNGSTWLSYTALYNGNLIVDGSILAHKLSVANLSAISANLGSITAGHISGVDGEFSGTLTADAIDAVDTINVRGEAVVAPRFVINGSTIYVPNSTTRTVLATAASINIPAISGRQALVSLSAEFATLTFGTVTATAELYRGSTLLRSKSDLFSYVDRVDPEGTPYREAVPGRATFSFSDSPPPGDHVYSLKIFSTNGSNAFNYERPRISDITLLVVANK